MPDHQTQHGADPLITPSEPGGGGSGGRARGEPRFDAEGIACHAGQVLDISGAGMRLLVAWKDAPRVGDVEHYAFGEGSEAVRVMGTVRWVRPAGRLHKRAQVGVEFVGLSPTRRDALRRFAATGDFGALRAGEHDAVRVEYPDLYKMFGVSPYASENDIRRAYHALSKDLHPDKSPDPDAGARFAELSKAYSILRDKELRARYDERLAREQQRVA
ncbi:MAG: DnaJ domain-containing protein [Phycisphaerales bacterium]|nr:DnaJ domain-containing protein [Planctomycetota bacterium]MCH8509102.1 DnaJ domain-containing protein [Phycisphaerales bacterium]